ncbi:hypothetical protein BC828DRAFT_406916 [Blastocladiella britannica]|nr:hypothetical protein BC828DRAFT_406916 [Blastocladiella britannica]
MASVASPDHLHFPLETSGNSRHSHHRDRPSDRFRNPADLERLDDDAAASGSGISPQPDSGDATPTEEKLRTGRARPRASQACAVCRKKKIRCDGVKPTCTYCMESCFPCTYEAPKRRGPPRKMPRLDGVDVPSDIAMANPIAAAAAVAASKSSSSTAARLQKQKQSQPQSQSQSQSLDESEPLSQPPPGNDSNTDTDWDHLRFCTTAELDSTNSSMLHVINVDPETGDCQHLRLIGPSHGIHFLRQDYPEHFQYGSLVADHPKLVPNSSLHAEPEELENVDASELPSAELQTLLIDFYFSYLRPLFPILTNEQVNMYQRNAKERNFYFELNSLYFMTSIWYVRAGKHRPDYFVAPDVHLARARAGLPRIASICPSLSRAAGLLMLSMGLAGDPSGTSWMMAGSSIRIAQDVGLHMDLARLAIREQFKDDQLRRAHVVWWCCYTVDRMLAAALGRPVTIHEEDFAVPMPDLSDLGYNPPEYVKDYAVHIRLVHIQGRVTNMLNRARAQVSMAHILNTSTLLEQWLASVPENLRFSFQLKSAQTPFALNLNLNYYYTLLMLYRPLLDSSSSSLTSTSPTAATGPMLSLDQITSICVTTVKAILFIYESARVDGVLSALTLPSAHALVVIITTLHLLYRNAPVAKVNLAELARYTGQALRLIEQLAPDWPFLKSVLPLAASVHERVEQSTEAAAFIGSVPATAGSAVSTSASSSQLPFLGASSMAAALQGVVTGTPLQHSSHLAMSPMSVSSGPGGGGMSFDLLHSGGSLVHPFGSAAHHQLQPPSQQHLWSGPSMFPSSTSNPFGSLPTTTTGLSALPSMASAMASMYSPGTSPVTLASASSQLQIQIGQPLHPLRHLTQQAPGMSTSNGAASMLYSGGSPVSYHSPAHTPTTTTARIAFPAGWSPQMQQSYQVQLQQLQVQQQQQQQEFQHHQQHLAQRQGQLAAGHNFRPLEIPRFGGAGSMPDLLGAMANAAAAAAAVVASNNGSGGGGESATQSPVAVTPMSVLGPLLSVQTESSGMADVTAGHLGSSGGEVNGAILSAHGIEGVGDGGPSAVNDALWQTSFFTSPS